MKLAARDRFMGWTATAREANIHLVVGNRRFLILPWVHVRGLASSLLSMVARRLPGDWQQRYAYTPVLVESFTEPGRVKGTSYAAVNWLLVGQSQGRGRLAPSGQSKSIKDIWVYPLEKRFRTILTGGRVLATQWQIERKTGDWALAPSGGSPE